MARDNDTIDRRKFLKAAGGAVAAVSIAGCSGGGDNNGNGGNNGGGDTGGNGGGGGGDTGGNDGGNEGGNETTTLTYARGNASSSLDPQNTTTGADVKVTNQMYDKLIEFKPGTTTLRAGLAKEWSVSGTTVMLTMREGVKFTNGDTLTAEDFVASYRRFTDESYKYYPGAEYTSGYAGYFSSPIKNVMAMGKHKLHIELKQPYAPILPNLAMFCASVLSKTAIKKLGKELQNTPVGTSAFKLKNWDTGNQRIRLERNSDYWGKIANVDQVLFIVVKQNTTRAQKLISGGAHIIDGIGTQAMGIIESASSAKLLSAPGINIGYLALNVAKVPEFRDPKVREAIKYGINTKGIVQNIFRGIAQEASQIIPKSVLGYNENLETYPYDPEKARQLLAEAGYADGFSITFSNFTNPRPYIPSPVQAAQVVRSNLADIGIDMTIKQMPWNQFLGYTASGKHDACFLGWMTDNGDPSNFYQLMDPGVKLEAIPEGQNWVSFQTEGYNSLNVSGWADEEFLKTIRAAQSTYDIDTREKLYEEAGKYSHDNAPFLFIDHAKLLRGIDNSVKNYKLDLIEGPWLNLVKLE